MSEPRLLDFEDIGLFSTVDRAPDPTLFLHFVDLANRVPGMRAAKDEMLEELRLQPGQAVLDVGCGTDDDAREIARRVGPEGRVVGVDASETMLTEARRRSLGVEPAVEFRLADAQSLPFDGAVFDACRTERVLAHVPDPRAALAEMARVTRPGGRICALDFDADAAGVDDAVTRALLETMTRRLRSGWVGRELPRLLAEAGMADVTVRRPQVVVDADLVRPLISRQMARLQEAGVVGAEEVERWWARLEAAHGRIEDLAPGTIVIVAGTRT